MIGRRSVVGRKSVNGNCEWKRSREVVSERARERNREGVSLDRVLGLERDKEREGLNKESRWQKEHVSGRVDDFERYCVRERGERVMVGKRTIEDGFWYLESGSGVRVGPG